VRGGRGRARGVSSPRSTAGGGRRVAPTPTPTAASAASNAPSRARSPCAVVNPSSRGTSAPAASTPPFLPRRSRLPAPAHARAPGVPMMPPRELPLEDLLALSRGVAVQVAFESKL
jgi:hypothetical protein